MSILLVNARNTLGHVCHLMNSLGYQTEVQLMVDYAFVDVSTEDGTNVSRFLVCANKTIGGLDATMISAITQKSSEEVSVLLLKMQKVLGGFMQKAEEERWTEENDPHAENSRFILEYAIREHKVTDGTKDFCNKLSAAVGFKVK